MLVAIVFLLARSGLSDVRAAAQTIGHDSEPSVLYARQIGLSLADMHASVANALLLGPGNDADSWKTYQQERQTVADNLVNAAQNITYPGEKDQIQITRREFRPVPGSDLAGGGERGSESVGGHGSRSTRPTT